MPRRFGIELELSTPGLETTGKILRRNDIGTIVNFDCSVPKRDKRRYTTGADGKWRVTGEGDCPSGCELVSPIFESDNPDCFATLEHLYNVLTSNEEFSVDEFCGLHVHVEAKEFNALSLAAVSRATYAFRNTLNKYALRHSEINHVWLREQLNDIATDGPPEGRAVLIENLQDNHDPIFSGFEREIVGFESWQRQGTIEYRQCAASFNYDDICRWIQIVIGITNWAAGQHNNWPNLELYEDHSQDLSQLVDVSL